MLNVKDAVIIIPETTSDIAECKENVVFQTTSLSIIPVRDVDRIDLSVMKVTRTVRKPRVGVAMLRDFHEQDAEGPCDPQDRPTEHPSDWIL